MSNTEPSFIKNFIRFLIENIKIVLIVQIVSIILSLIYVLNLDPWYRSTAKVVIQSDSRGGLLSSLSGALPAGLIGGGGQEDAERYISYINTRRLLDSLDTNFNLTEVYESEYRNDLYSEIKEHLHYTNEENGTFTISFDYQNEPQKASQIANFIYDKLYEFAQEVKTNQATNYREYIGNYYDENKKDLKLARREFASFQDSTGLYNLGTQLNILLEGISRLEAEKINTEIQLNFLKNIDNNSPNVKSLQIKQKEIQKQINKIKKSNTFSNVALDSLPDLAIKYSEKYNRIKINEKVSEFLRIQYEEALLEEQKKTINLYLLDPATPSDKKVKPKRSTIMILTFFFTFITVIFSLKARDYYVNNKEYFVSS